MKYPLVNTVKRISKDLENKSLEEAVGDSGRYSLNFGHWRTGNGKSFTNENKLKEFLENNYISRDTRITYSKDCTDEFRQYFQYEDDSFNKELFKQGYTSKTEVRESFETNGIDESVEDTVTRYMINMIPKDDYETEHAFIYAESEEEMRKKVAAKYDLNDWVIGGWEVQNVPAFYKTMDEESVTEAFDVDKVQKRIARVDEFDNGHVFFNYEKMTSAEAEEKARQMSIKNPDKVFYVKYDDIMEPCSDIKWKNGKQLS